MRRLLVVVGIVLAVLVLAVLAVPLIVTGDFVASRAADAVAERTGRQLTFGGPVELSLFPDIRLSAENVSLSNADWAETEDMVRFERLDAEAGLFDLIGGTLDLRRMVLIRPQVNLEIAESGQANWHFPAGDATVDADRGEPADGEPDAPMDLRLGDVRIEGARISYVDRMTGRTVLMDEGRIVVAWPEPSAPLSVDGSAVVNGRPITLMVEADAPRRLAAGGAADLTGAVVSEALDLRFGLTADAERQSASGPVSLAIPSVGDLARWLDAPVPDPLPINTVGFDGTVVVAPKTAGLSDFSLRLDDMAAVGSASLDSSDAVPKLTADLRLSALDVDRLVAAAAVGDPSGNGGAPPPRRSTADDGRTAEDGVAAAWAALQAVEVDLGIAVDGMTLQGREIGPTRLVAALEGGQLEAHLTETAMLGGTVAGRISADADAAPATIEARATIDGIDAGPLLMTFGPFSAATLPISAQLDLAAAGDTQAALVSNLSGSLSVGIENGGLSLPNPAVEASAIALTAELPGFDGPVAASGTVTLNGAPVSWSLDVAAPRAFVSGAGSALAVSLVSEPVTLGFDGQASAAPSASGRVDLNVPSVGSFLAWLPGAPAGLDPPVEAVALSTSVELTPTRVALSELQGTVDETTTAGELAVDTGGPVPSLYAHLGLGRVDLDRFAAPASGEGGGGTAGDATAGGWSTEPIDLSGLRAANVDAVVSADAIVAQGTEVGPTEVTLSLADGELNLTIPGAPVFAGVVAVDLRLDGSGAVPAMALQASAQGVQAQPLLARFAGTDRLSGTTAMTVDVTASGASQRDLVQALDGSADVMFSDGALAGINIAAILRNPIGYLQGGAETDAPSTDFAEFGGSFTIADGIASTDDLRMLAPLFRVEGGGTVSLPPQTLDLRLTPTLVPTLEGQGGRFEQAGLQVPILIQGSFAAPSIRPDFGDLAVDIIGDPAQAADAIEQLGQGASPQDILGGFLGGGTSGDGASGADGGQPSPEDALRGLGENLLGGGQEQEQEPQQQPAPADAVGDTIRGLFSR